LKYHLVYTRRAVKDITKLEAGVKQRIGKTLLRYQQDPLKHAEKLTVPGLGAYRFRIGHYRVIFDIEDSDIVILRVGHRKEMYKG
jgi:mRNA interferase RelE/StbE